MGKKNKRKKRLRAIAGDEQRIRRMLSANGITLAVRGINGRMGNRISWHWMFDTGGRRVLDYWPTSGTYRLYREDSEEKGKAASMEHAANMAISVVIGKEVVSSLNGLALEWTQDQRNALAKIEAFRDGRLRWEELSMGGLAGTGKTTLLAYVASEWRGAAVVALCGKAANVLREKGIDAQTIHSLIYTVDDEDESGRPRFVRKEKLDGVRAIIVDEASMVNTSLYEDITSFGLPVLWVGDHGQLEPIGDNPGLMSDPDIRLEVIHRQASGNPIIRLAQAFREGRDVPHWRDPLGRLEVTRSGDFRAMVSRDVQMICGFNRTRRDVNTAVREMAGTGERLVVPGERIIVLKNNRDLGLFNGQQVTCERVGRFMGRGVVHLDIAADDGHVMRDVPFLTQQFGNDLVKTFERSVVLGDYGYCVTAHKSQGSEYSEVLALEEISSLWDARRWRYTVATRAAEKLTYCR